jgi:hypothetical protein
MIEKALSYKFSLQKGRGVCVINFKKIEIFFVTDVTAIGHQNYLVSEWRVVSSSKRRNRESELTSHWSLVADN